MGNEVRRFAWRAMLLVGATLPAAGALAQATGPAAIEEIVVTAQKRAESVQAVPLAITAFSASALRDRSVRTITDLQSGTPNVSFDATPQGSTTATIGIRGIKSDSVQLSTEQPVATYVDGVFMASALGSSVLLGPDLARVEVLRGPQGTLYGRNSIGGAINLITQQPVDELTGRVMGGMGNYGRRDLQAMLNVPLGDKAATRFNAGYVITNGFSKDLTTGKALGDQNDLYLRNQIKLTPSDALTVLLRGDFMRARGGGNVLQNVFLTPPTFFPALTPASSPSLTFLAAALGLGLSPAPASYDAVRAAYLRCGGGLEPNLQPKCYSNDDTVGYTYRDYGGSLDATYDLTDTVALRSITAYRKFRQRSGQDYDASVFPVLFSYAFPYGRTITQEGQLNGTLFADRLKFALGVYYYNFHSVEDGENNTLRQLTGANSRNYLHAPHRDSSIGTYFQGTYSLTEALRATAGIRYTNERKEVDVTQFQSRPAPTPFACTLPLPNAECVNSAVNKYGAVDWTGGLDYDLAPDVMAYARAAKGFQAGGINQRSTTGVAFQSFKPQTAINYELGLKSELLDRRLRFNLSLFQTDLKQAQQNVARTFIVNNLPVSVVGTVNAASARIRGIEVETLVVPFENAAIQASLGFLDPKYKKFLATGPLGPDTLDLSDSLFMQTPKWSIGVSPSYTVPLPYGSLRLQLDYYYRSRSDLAPVLSYPTVVPGDKHIQGGYRLLNGRLALRLDGGTEIALWAKNLTDKRYFNNFLDLAGSLGFTNGKVGDPRTYGFEISHSF